MISVAVVIPCYNTSKYVSRTIESALLQTGVNVEIIAVDDGSTDNTLSVIKTYEPHIRVLTHQGNANLGQAASLNLAIENSESEFIAFLDSDDIWYQGKLEKQVEILNKYPNVGLVYTGGHVIDECDNVLYNLFPKDFVETNSVGSILLNCYIRTPSSVMVRRDILRQVGKFDTRLTISDHDMWIRMSETTKFYYLHDALTGYRQRLGQSSSKRRQWEDGFIVLNKSCKRFSYGSRLRAMRLAVLHYRLGKHDLNSKKYPTSFYNFMLAMLYDPIRSLKAIKKTIVN
jgi:glycosyltransferase involved in cell wall biosynthesis